MRQRARPAHISAPAFDALIGRFVTQEKWPVPSTESTWWPSEVKPSSPLPRCNASNTGCNASNTGLVGLAGIAGKVAISLRDGRFWYLYDTVIVTSLHQ